MTTGRTIPSILISVLMKLSQKRLLPFGKATSDFSHALIYKSSMVTSLEEIKLWDAPLSSNTYNF